MSNRGKRKRLNKALEVVPENRRLLYRLSQNISFLKRELAKKNQRIECLENMVEDTSWMRTALDSMDTLLCDLLKKKTQIASMEWDNVQNIDAFIKEYREKKSSWVKGTK